MKNKWQRKILEDVCEFVGGSQPPKSTFSFEEKKEYVRLIQIRDYKSENYKVYVKKNSTKKFCTADDVMIGRYGPPVFQILKGLTGAYNVALMKAVPDESQITKDFLYHFLQTPNIQEYIISLSERAAGQSGVNKGALNEYPIYIPLIPEQKRIVKILDEAFAAIEKAKENAEKNLKNSKELFDSYLQSVFAKPGKDWEERRLEDLGTITSSKRIYKKEYVKKGVPFYRTKEIKELANSKSVSTKLYITEERYSVIKKSFGVPSEGDILLTAIGTIGEMYIVNNNEKFYFKDGNVLWFKNFKSVDTIYLKFILLSFVEHIKRLAIGSAYNALPIEKLKKYKVKLPLLKEQKLIVSKLNSLSQETKKLETIYNQKLGDLDELKKSILQKAFSGEL
ncbi:MAG: restriction endonuclease subunit S [Bacteroidetes bacterium]|nr:restriction endonuclease subunit S [Bacteroidota bacterium]